MGIWTNSPDLHSACQPLPGNLTRSGMQDPALHQPATRMQHGALYMANLTLQQSEKSNTGGQIHGRSANQVEQHISPCNTSARPA